MRNKFAAFALAAMLAVQAGAAFAEDGPMTSSGNPAWTYASFPLRLTTGVAGGALGALGGGVKGIMRTEKTFAENTYAHADENPLMIPIGLIGSVVAIPVGFVTGAPEGAASGAQTGYRLWDHF